MFLKLTMLTSEDPIIVALAQIVAVQGASAGSNVFVTGGLNQWLQVKEPAAEIFETLKNVLEA